MFASDPPYGRPATRCTWRCASRRQAGLDEQAHAGVLGGTMAALLDGRGLPPAQRAAARTVDHALRAPGARLRLREPRRPGAVRGRRSSRRSAMLDMALAACRDPRARRGRRGARDDRRGARGGDALLDSRGRRAAGDRPRVSLDRARRDRDPGPRSCSSERAATARGVRPSARSASTPPTRRSSRRSRSRSPRRSRTPRATSSTSRAAARRDQLRGRQGMRSRELEQQRAQQVRDDDQPAPVIAGVRPGSARGAGRSGAPRSRRR